MAVENTLRSISLLAGSDLSAKQYYLVKGSGAASTVALAGAGEGVIGVLQDKPAAAGRACAVGISGVSKAVAGAAVAANAYVTADANGKAVTAASGDQIAGLALTAAGADLGVFELLVKSYGVAP